jgi:uncharacterized protein YjbI with pentapeptide repeats
MQGEKSSLMCVFIKIIGKLMANQEQLEFLKQGVETWNKWRSENLSVEIDLSGANLSGVCLNGVYLMGGNLMRAVLIKTNLTKAYLTGVDFNSAHLAEANLSKAYLNEVNLRGGNLRGANLNGANLNKADLSMANLRGASLSETNLSETIFRLANLSKTKFNNARFGSTIFADVDLSEVYGLENAQHQFPSHISIDTIRYSKGKIPEVFLRGCGLSDLDIEYSKLYKPGLTNQEIIDINYKIFDLHANQSIQISPLFISYSHADALFVEKLEPCFIKKGIRFWRDVHDATSGRLEKQIDLAMRQNPTVVLILSENSTRSDWVEHEARLARELEKDLGRDVLCPIALDDSWKSAKWPARLMEQIKEYNILDYSKWKDDKAFGQVFNKMIAGLDMFYKPEK